jgi:hypothetical protein
MLLDHAGVAVPESLGHLHQRTPLITASDARGGLYWSSGLQRLDLDP